ncbi:hypothetical protein D3C87_1116690 [compost metagenome]
MATFNAKLGMGQQTLNDTSLEKLKVKATDGELLCEFQAPRLVQGASIQEKADRYRMIVGDRVCARINRIYRAEDGNIYGDVEAYGPMSKTLKQLVERGTTDKIIFGMRTVMKAGIADVITYDLVTF